jgi:hypothetical protein
MPKNGDLKFWAQISKWLVPFSIITTAGFLSWLALDHVELRGAVVTECVQKSDYKNDISEIKKSQIRMENKIDRMIEREIERYKP